MPQFPANIDLSSLDGTTGFKLIGAAAGDRGGTSVASTGARDEIRGSPPASERFSFVPQRFSSAPRTCRLLCGSLDTAQQPAVEPKESPAGRR